MMTAQQIALRLAKYIGVTSLDPADPANTANPLKPALVPGDIDDIVAAINGGLQELWDFAPAAMRYQRIGSFLRAPMPVTVDAQNYSKTVTIHGYEPWMAGCSLRFNGDVADNEIHTETTLLREYLGATATGVSATVYHDCITPDSSVLEIVGPVEIPQVRRLENAGSRAEFYCYDRTQVGGDDYGHIWIKLNATAKQPAQPWAYFVDTDYSPDQDGLSVRLRFLPVPDTTYPIAYGARINAPSITAQDIGTTDDPGTTFPIPGNWDESVLLPMALKRFSGHPSFGAGNPFAGAEIDRQYKMALKITGGETPNRASVKMICTFR